VFVSSPGDVRAEREVVAAAIERLAAAAHIKWFCSLEACLYERTVPPLIGRPPQHAVDLFMMRPAECDVLVCVLGHRMGTPVLDPRTGESFGSGTEYELISAHRSSRRPRPRILVYRSELPAQEPVDEPQRQALAAFLAEIGSPTGRLPGMRPAPFSDPARLREMVLEHLGLVVWRLVLVRVARRVAQVAAAFVLLSGLLVGSYFLGRSCAAQTGHRAEAQAVIDTAIAGTWDPVADLDRLGCTAVDPLAVALAKVEGWAEAAPTRAIVSALRKLLARGETCAAAPLVGVLLPADPAHAYGKSAQRVVLEALDGIDMPDKRRILCAYLGNIAAPSPYSGNDGAMPLDDLKDLAQKALGGSEVNPCSKPMNQH
jgi:hypothetical protein